VKEIGIRKVLGASVTDLVKLLTKDFMLLVIIGSIAACPLTYYFISKWLQNFAYKIHFSVFPYLLAIVITFFVAVIVVGIRTIIASSANPVKSLRYE
jgi:putative ABC transport system permease protein